MRSQDAMQEIRSQWRQLMPLLTTEAEKQVNGEESYVCPLCGHGTHGDGMTYNPQSRDRNGLKCFGCGFSGDIIDLYRKVNGTDLPTALTALGSELGLDIEQDGYTAQRGSASDFDTDTPDYTQEAGKAGTEAPGAPQDGHSAPGACTDYSEYFHACQGRLASPEALDYLSFRGISPDTARAYGLGFDPMWRSPKAVREGKKPPCSPRLIIPTSSTSYIARDTRQELPEEARKYAKLKEGKVSLFNPDALQNPLELPVFITEGEIDALSIIEAGMEAVALGSTSNIQKLLRDLQENRTGSTLILCLDNDGPGRKAEAELAKSLERLNISFVRANICGEHKDPNEALTADRKKFREALEEAVHQTASKPDNMGDYLQRIFAGEIQKFIESSTRKTGFDNLDQQAGGIYPGLYVVGAISSLGKTTFIHQMADQMAAAGEHVLFFSLEQSRFEMASKSLARITTQRDIKNAVTSLDIRRGKITQAVQDALKTYEAAVGDRLSVIEGNFNCNISFIGDYVDRYMKQNGVKPVVIVDYLQILDGAPDQRQTAKDVVDTNVRELKRLSRNADIPVIVISSLNRNNYLTPVDFESFKESGGIEYTADVIWGLQLAVMNDQLFNSPNKIKEKRDRVKAAKAENPRKIQLVCLKNRYGVSSFTCDFLYYPANDLYSPADFDEEWGQ